MAGKVLLVNHGNALMANTLTNLLKESEIETIRIEPEMEKVTAEVGKADAIMIFAALYTTTCPLLWSSITPFAKDGTPKYKMMVIVGTLIGFVVAMLVPYEVIMNYAWVISGWVGLGVTIIMVARVIWNFVKLGKDHNLPKAE